jgi:lipid A ethanolaminephosphotransferase
VPTEVLADATIPEFCSTGECFDEVLLVGLDDLLAQLRTDTLIVLHQRGSHGPAYHRRYPAAFRRFVPTCETNDLRECSREAILNTYDNTILYTDHVLGETIRLLRRHADRLDIALVYVSDHGESLGENSLYLHSLPYWIAPDEQTHIPFLVWFMDDMALDSACIAGRRDQPFSHDYLFHTILGLMDVETQVYDPALDLLDPCRREPAPRGRPPSLRGQSAPARRAVPRGAAEAVGTRPDPPLRQGTGVELSDVTRGVGRDPQCVVEIAVVQGAVPADM